MNKSDTASVVAIKKNSKIRALMLDQVFLDARGVDFKSQDTSEPLTLKICLQIAMTLHKAATAQEALKLVELAESIRNAEAALEIPLSDALALEQVIDKNPAQWGAILLGQIFRALKGA